MIETFLMALAIVLARISDVIFGTLKTIAVVKGWRWRATTFGFFEVAIWLISSSAVLVNITAVPVLGIAYCVGYAAGTWFGMQVEQWIASGDSVIRVLTKKGDEVASTLRTEGCIVSRFDGKSKGQPISLLYIDIKRKTSGAIIEEVRKLDEEAFCTIDDVRIASPRQ